MADEYVPDVSESENEDFEDTPPSEYQIFSEKALHMQRLFLRCARQAHVQKSLNTCKLCKSISSRNSIRS